MRALLAVLLLAPGALAADHAAPAVALLVRDGAWPYGTATLAVDGEAVTLDALDGAVRARLAGPSPLTLRLGANSTEVVVHVASPVEVPASVHTAGRVGGVARGEAAAPVLLGPGREPQVRFAATEDQVVWVRAGDDPSGRFAAGEVLQAALLDWPGPSYAAKTVLVEAHRCASCGGAEAAARAVASAYMAGPPDRAGYARAPTVAEAVAMALFVGLAAAVFVPWRRP